MTKVVAVLCADGAHPELAEETRVALGAQTRPPDAIVESPAGAGLPVAAATGIRAALAGGAEWVWLLDGVTVPQPEALEALLEAAHPDPPLPPPLLVASDIRDEQGRPHPDALPRHELFEKQITVDAVEQGLVHLRMARHGSLMVSRSAVERFGLPRPQFTGGYDVEEWTTRILRRWDDPGYLATRSVAVRRLPAARRDRREEFRNRLRMLAGGAYSPTERLYAAYLLMVDAGAAMAARAPARRA